MICDDSPIIDEHAVSPEEYTCVPEMVYEIDNGLPTGISTVGYRTAAFTPLEAQRNLQQRYAVSDMDVNNSEQTRGDTTDLMQQTTAEAAANAENSRLRLTERLHDTNFWKTELEREIKDIISITDKLVKRKQELQNSLMAVERAILVCTDNINARQRRYGENSQQDDVEYKLIKELDILNKATKLLKQAIKSCDGQIKKNRDIKQDLEMIWSDKLEAGELIEEAANLTPESTSTQFFAGEARRHPLAAQSTVESWAQHSHDAILRSEHERMASEQLLTMTCNILHDVSNGIMQQKDLVNAVLQQHLAKLNTDLFNTKEKLKKVVAEITKLERSIRHLRCSISDKDNYLKLLQTRLHLHNQRPGVENARDPAQQSLLDELTALEESLNTLHDQMNVSEIQLQKLYDDQMTLEKQIQSTEHAIQIDRDHVVRHRYSFPNAEELQGRR